MYRERMSGADPQGSAQSAMAGMSVIAGLVAAIAALAMSSTACLLFLAAIGFDLKAPVSPDDRWVIYFIVGVASSTAVMAFHGARKFVADRPAVKSLVRSGVTLAVGLALVAGGPKLYRKWQLHQTMITAQSEFQKQLPKTIDGNTTLVSVNVGYTDWTYSYTVTGRKPDLDALEGQVREGVCASGMKTLIAAGASYRYEYRNASGAIIGKINVASCP